jgi:hypothetical protein
MTWDEFDNDATMVFDYLDEYQQKALNDAVSGFGYNQNTFDTMLYVWFGMELEAFIDSVLE